MAKAQESAEYEREFESSPINRQSNTSTLAANAYFSVDYEVNDRLNLRYLPYNSLLITNSDTASSLDLYINGQGSPIKRIKPATAVSFDELALPAVRSFALKNVGSTTIAAGDIEVVAQRTAISTQKIAQGAHRALYGQKRTRG